MKIKPFNASFSTRARLLSCLSLLVAMLAPGTVLAYPNMSRTDTPVGQDAWRQFWDDAANVRYPRHDPNYIEGKEVYLGKGSHAKYNFCLAGSATQEPVILSRRNLKPYRKMEVIDFVKVLYDCDKPGELILPKLNKEDAGKVVYYLHARYKLRLTNTPRQDNKKVLDERKGMIASAEK